MLIEEYDNPFTPGFGAIRQCWRAVTSPIFSAPWKGAFSLWVRNPFSNCRFGW